jgi:ABC-2 type transport system ATP-binding protein
MEAKRSEALGSADLLRAEGLSKSFGRNSALHNVSFGVAPGEIVGVVGPNAAGKSTTFRIICGLLRSSSGTVCIDGFDDHHEWEA